MKCPNCKELIPDGSKDCSFCGKKVFTFDYFVSTCCAWIFTFALVSLFFRFASKHEFFPSIFLLISLILTCPLSNKKIEKQYEKLGFDDFKLLSTLKIVIIMVMALSAIAICSLHEEKIKRNEIGTEQKQKKKVAEETAARKAEQQQKQQRLNVINNIIKEGQKGGLIKDIRKGDDGSLKWMHLIVDENIWNQLPYDTKQQMWQMCLEYYHLTGYLTGIVGYYSGKSVK